MLHALWENKEVVMGCFLDSSGIVFLVDHTCCHWIFNGTRSLTVLSKSPSSAYWLAFVLGAIYGFGGLSFGYTIRNIGYSLSYTISIGISAVLGTIGPLIINGGWSTNSLKLEVGSYWLAWLSPYWELPYVAGLDFWKRKIFLSVTAKKNTVSTRNRH